MECEANEMIDPAVALPSMPLASAPDARLDPKVLLCAAASAPAQSGAPYDVPLIQQLFRSLVQGKRSPVCRQSHARRLGSEPCQPCPADLPPVQKKSGGQILAEPPNGAFGADFSQIGYPCLVKLAAASYATQRHHAIAALTAILSASTRKNGARRFYFSPREHGR